MSVINLTPHPIHLYAPGIADGATDAALRAAMVATIPASGRTARLASTSLGRVTTVEIGGATIHVEGVRYGKLGSLPEPQPGTWYVVPLLSALAARDRSDLLVPHEQIRNQDGTVVGCTAFGRLG